MTLMRDTVRWALPLGVLGAPALPLVKRDLRQIFDYRARRVAELIG